MKKTGSVSPDSPDIAGFKKNADKTSAAHKRHRINWHEAASSAVMIELRDYADMLDFYIEYMLGKNLFRIDMLIIKKNNERPIHKNIARNFKEFNIFEIKGIGSCAGTESYYKAVFYAFYYIIQSYDHKKASCSPLNVTITLLSCHYPGKLIRHLTIERGLSVKKLSDGIYVVENPSIYIQLVVTSRLPPEENLYLRCITNELNDPELIKRLADDYVQHQDNEIYIKYMNQLVNANNRSDKEENPMVCEGILNLFGTSSEEIIANTKKQEEAFYMPQIDELKNDNEKLLASNKQLSSTNKQLSSSNEQLASFNTLLTDQVSYLKDLLKQNNIKFDLNTLSINKD